MRPSDLSAHAPPQAQPRLAETDDGGVVSPARHRRLGLPVVPDQRGALTFIEQGRHIPFEIKRVFYIYDVPEGKTRGSHSRVGFDEVIVAVAGSFEVVLDYGDEQCVLTLDRPDGGLFLPGAVWRELRNFSPGAVCLVLASERYDGSTTASTPASAAEQ